MRQYLGEDDATRLFDTLEGVMRSVLLHLRARRALEVGQGLPSWRLLL